MYVYAPCTCLWWWRPEEGIESFGTRAIDSCELPCQCLEASLCPLEEKHVLSASEPSLQLLSCACLKPFWFVVSFIDCLENSGSVNSTNHSNTGVSLHCVLKTLRVFLKAVGKCQARGSRYRFSKFLIFAWMLKFYHRQTKLPIVFLEMTDYFVRFCNACQILKSAEP